MSKSKVGPEAKIINGFLLLPEDSKRIVLDVIKSQSAAPRKAPAKKAPASPVVALKESETVPPGLCGFKYPEGSVCLAIADNAIHDKSGGYSGYHPFEAPKSVARATRKLKPKQEAPGSDQSPEIPPVVAGSVALGANANGD